MPANPSKHSRLDRLGYRLSSIALRAVLGLFLLIPYRARIAAAGWVCSRWVAPLARYRTRIRTNLRLTNPDLPEAEIERLVRAVPDNAGRTVIEVFSSQRFMDQAAQADLTGPGVEALHAARAAGRAVILNTAHFGNFYAIRGRMQADGYEMGSLYRRMANPYFNDYYVEQILGMGPPIFEQSKRGMRDLVKHLRGGGMLGILNDVHVFGGEQLTFFGQTAYTSLSTAELAVKFDCLLLPVFVIRQPDGISFRIEVLDPVDHGDPVEMTQRLNDITETMVRAHMDQWFWIHRRWRVTPG
ncbi:MAG: lysophospholipid acyltransferase family protein [Marinibacterium sp.]|nr:lysophospholipid acyltransferase family protein [Marinibacterium sp.]